MDGRVWSLPVLALLAGCEISVSGSSDSTFPEPETRIVASPWGEVPEPEARLEFTGTEAVAFECSLDGRPFQGCTSPHTTATLTPGLHRFSVRAVGRNESVDSTPVSTQWRIIGAKTETECPPLVPGENTIRSAGHDRRFVLQLPGDPGALPVVFLWHWLAGDPYQALLASGLLQQGGIIVVAPYPTGEAPYTWHAELPPDGNPDIALFDDVLVCLEQQFGIDNNRVWSTGLSAGALWTTYLLMHRASRLGAVSEISGGLPDPSVAPPFTIPAIDVPVLLAWGGPGDVFEDPNADFQFNDGDPTHFSFDVASRRLSDALRREGHFVLECPGNYPHGLPPDPTATLWNFLRDHPRGATPEPYANGDLPEYLPDLCYMP